MDRQLAEEAIERLDTLCDLLHRLAAKSAKDDWPENLQIACQTIARNVLSIAGALDKADGNYAAVTAEAMAHLRKDFAAFGQAFTEDLQRLVSPEPRPHGER